jgi:serine/threonine-protein kinase RsbW
VPDPLSRDNILRGSGRGLLLIRAFVDEVDINPVEPTGTEVVMVKFSEPQGRGVSENNKEE